MSYDTMVEKFTHNGFTVRLHIDVDCRSPREESNIGFFLGYKHRDYLIGDEQIDPREVELRCPGCGGDGVVAFDLLGEELERDCPICEGYGQRPARSFEDFVQYVRDEWGAVGPVLPIGMYDHGNVSYYVGRHVDQWDGGHAGLIFATRATLDETHGEGVTPPDEDLTKWLTGEVEEYSRWASGDCYGYVITDLNGDEVDSCWGFIGHEYAVEAAKEAVPDHLPDPLTTCRLTDRTLDAIEAALEASTTPAWPQVMREESQRALEIVRGIRAGSDPEGESQWGSPVMLVAHPPLKAAGRRANFRLNPEQRRMYAERGWLIPDDTWSGR